MHTPILPTKHHIPPRPQLTTKWHIHNILSKLGVKRRTQAVGRARELELI